MVQQHVALADGREEVRRASKSEPRRREERRVLQIGPVEPTIDISRDAEGPVDS